MRNGASGAGDAAEQPLLIGEWTLNASLNELQREGTTIRLEPKAIELLVFLAGRRGEVIGREALLSAVWPGAVVGDDSLTQAVIKLRRALGDDAHSPSYIETISKRGYRLIAAVSRPTSPMVDSGTNESATKQNAEVMSTTKAPPLFQDDPAGNIALPIAEAFPLWPPRFTARRAGLLFAAVAIVVVLVLSEIGGTSSTTAQPAVEATRQEIGAEPTVAVLPLINLSGDPQREYFSDGVTQDVIAALGRFSALRVMSLNAVAQFKSREVLPPAIHTELGATYVVRGSLRESAGTYRVSVELSDATTGVVLWSDRLEGQGREIFEIQDRIVLQVAGRVAGNVARLEQERALAKPPANMLAYDQILRARALLLVTDRVANRNARALLEQAIQLAPNYGEALVGLGQAEHQRAVNGWVEDAADSLKKAEEYLYRAIAVGDPGSRARAHGELSMIFTAQGQLEQALTEADSALDVNPSDAFVYDRRGIALMYLGRIDEAIASMNLGVRLDPSVRGLGSQFSLALANYTLGRYEESLRLVDRALERYPSAADLHALRAATLARLERMEEARAAIAELNRFAPFFDPGAFGSRFVNQAHRTRIREGLRKAGL